VSGFAGEVRIDSCGEATETERSAIERMASAIAFRGPDSLQKTLLPGASFAFSLLKTGPAPQESSQPCTLDGRTWLLGDVRCDGREELIRKLEEHGVALQKPASSEQLVLHYFAKFGEAGLAELEGDLSFVLWSPQERKLIAFRDLTGSRPFFYSHRDSVLVFSNTIQALISHPCVARGEYDLQFIADFLLGSPNHDPERTIYRDMRRLPAGHLLQFSPSGFSVSRIANFPIEELLHKQDKEIIQIFRQKFSQAVADRLPSTETSIFLSGGLDSTTIAAAAVDLRRQESLGNSLRLSTLCVDVQPLFEDDEARYAERFAKTFGLPFELAHCGHILPFEGADDATITQPEPTPWPYWTLQSFFFLHVAKNARVAFTGDGGDEIMRCQVAPYLRYVRSHRGLAAAARILLGYTISRRRIPSLGLGIRSWAFRLLGLATAHAEFPLWLRPDVAKKIGLRDRFAVITRKTWSHPFNPRAYSFFNGPTFSMAMEEQDATWTGFPVESRAPFLDRRLLRFLLRLPPVPWFMDKELIRRSQKGVLPEEIRLRGKTPLRLEPMLEHVASGKWLPRAPATCPEPLDGLVDWKQLRASFESASGHELYLHARPVSLALWLANNEKTGIRFCHSRPWP
jgi:asparagine synthase (glutamine-hydrolysing)